MKVGTGMKMLIEPIQYQLVATKFKKTLEVLRFEPRVAGFEVSMLVNKVDPVQVGP